MRGRTVNFLCLSYERLRTVTEYVNCLKISVNHEIAIFCETSRFKKVNLLPLHVTVRRI